MSIGPLDVSFLHPGIDQPNDTTAKDEKIADLKLLDESFLDRTEPAAAQENADETLRNDRSDIDQELARDPRMGDRDDAVRDRDLPEKPGVLPLQRFPAAGQIFENMVELFALQSAKRIGSPNDFKRFVDRDRGERSHPDNVLREDVVRLFQDLNRIEDAPA